VQLGRPLPLFFEIRSLIRFSGGLLQTKQTTPTGWTLHEAEDEGRSNRQGRKVLMTCPRYSGIPAIQSEWLPVTGNEWQPDSGRQGVLAIRNGIVQPKGWSPICDSWYQLLTLADTLQHRVTSQIDSNSIPERERSLMRSSVSANDCGVEHR
jgi:hypothetical protein